jgi:hypothetical protein
MLRTCLLLCVALLTVTGGSTGSKSSLVTGIPEASTKTRSRSFTCARPVEVATRVIGHRDHPTHRLTCLSMEQVPPESN